MKDRNINSYFGIIILAVVIVVTAAGYFLLKPGDTIIEGQVEATQVRVASKLSGRVENIFIKEGQAVNKGEALVVINSPELEAKYSQALAAKRAAGAQRNKAYQGARVEEVRSAREMWLRAKAASDLAEKTFNRVNTLFKDGVIAEQKYDEAKSQLEAAQRGEDAAKAAYDMASSGARSEDKESAQALLDQASGMVSEVQSYLRETRLTSPINGEVVDILAEQGELISQGYPVITVVDLSDIWITFNIRENLLSGARMGDIIKVKFPALENREIDFRINYIAPLGDFATWRSTKSTGEFDMRTFEIRAVPLEAVADLRPGMTSLINWNDAAAFNKKHRKKSAGNIKSK